MSPGPSPSPRASTITANNQTKVYGADLPTLTASYSGFVNGDTAASLDALPTLSTTATAASGAGAYTITASGAVDPITQYRMSAGHLTVTSAGLTITADNQTKVYGAALPTLTASYSGFVNGDTFGQPDYSAHAFDDGYRQQPCLGQPLHHHRQRRGGCRLPITLCHGEPHRHGRAADDHGE